MNPDANEMGKLTTSANAGVWTFAKIAQACCPRCERVKAVINILKEMHSDIKKEFEENRATEDFHSMNAYDHAIDLLEEAMK